MNFIGLEVSHYYCMVFGKIYQQEICVFCFRNNSKRVLDSFFIRIFKILYTHKHICKYKYDILIDDS